MIKRNIKVCKKLKDKYNLTYGERKENVKREKLDNPNKVKYKIYDTIKAILPHCTSPNELQSLRKQVGVETEFKFRRTTGEIEGISFSYNNIAFKGSEVDQKFSYTNLRKEFEKTIIAGTESKNNNGTSRESKARSSSKDRNGSQRKSKKTSGGKSTTHKTKFLYCRS